MTQKERVLRHMKDRGSISSFEAFSEYGITRLAARIHELRDDGHSIKASVHNARNRYGKKVTFERYTLEE